MTKDNSKISQKDEINFIDNACGEVIVRKSEVALSSYQVRPKVLGAFVDVFEEDLGIFEALRVRR